MVTVCVLATVVVLLCWPQSWVISLLLGSKIFFESSPLRRCVVGNPFFAVFRAAFATTCRGRAALRAVEKMDTRNSLPADSAPYYRGTPCSWPTRVRTRAAALDRRRRNTVTAMCRRPYRNHCFCRHATNRRPADAITEGSRSRVQNHPNAGIAGVRPARFEAANVQQLYRRLLSILPPPSQRFPSPPNPSLEPGRPERHPALQQLHVGTRSKIVGKGRKYSLPEDGQRERLVYSNRASKQT